MKVDEENESDKQQQPIISAHGSFVRGNRNAVVRLVEIDPLALDHQGSFADLEVDRADVFAKHSKKKELQPREEEESDDQRGYARLGKLAIIDQVHDQAVKTVKNAQGRHADAAEHAQPHGDVG